MRYEKFIRFVPKLFVLAAALDFIKYVQSLLPFWLVNRELIFSGEDRDFNHYKATVDLVYRLIDVIIYPLAWIGTAIIITLLIELYDRGRAPNA